MLYVSNFLFYFKVSVMVPEETKIEEIKNSQIKDKQQLMQWNETLTLISERIDKYKRYKVERENNERNAKRNLKKCLPPYTRLKLV